MQNQMPNLIIMDEKLEFLKGIFNLKNKEVDWGVVQENTYEDNEKVVEHKPGLYIKDSRVFVDLYARRFYSIIKLPEIKREILPAKLLIVSEETMFANDDTDDIYKPTGLTRMVYGYDHRLLKAIGVLQGTIQGNRHRCISTAFCDVPTKSGARSGDSRSPAPF